MSVIKTVGQGVAWSTLTNVLGKFIVFLNVFFILKYLSVYYYGLAQLVLSVVATMGIFLLPGLSSMILADLATERARGEFGKMKSLFLQFFSLNIGLALIGWTLLFFGADIAAHLAGNDAIGTLLKIISFTLLISPLRTVSIVLASVELRYFDQTAYGLVEEVTKFAALMVFFFVLHMGIDGLLFAIVFSQFATVCIYAPRTLSAYRVFGKAKAREWHAFWHVLRNHRKWGVANSYIGTLVSTLQIWIIRYFLGTEAVGLFAFADGIYGQVASFLPLGNVLAPLLPRYIDAPRDFARYVKSAVKAQFLVSLLLVVATFVGLPVLVLIFPKYAPAVPIIHFMIFGIIASGISVVYTPAFTALKQQRSFLNSITWKAAFVGVIGPVSISLFGLRGIGIGDTCIQFASALERTWRLMRILPEFRLNLRDLFVIDTTEAMFIRTWWSHVRSKGILSAFK